PVLLLPIARPPSSPPFPSTPLFRSLPAAGRGTGRVNDTVGDAALAPAYDLVHAQLLEHRASLPLFDDDAAPRHPAGLGHDLPSQRPAHAQRDRKSTRLNSSHVKISYAV